MQAEEYVESNPVIGDIHTYVHTTRSPPHYHHILFSLCRMVNSRMRKCYRAMTSSCQTTLLMMMTTMMTWLMNGMTNCDKSPSL